MLLSISVSGIDMSIGNEFAALDCKMNFRSVLVSFLSNHFFANNENKFNSEQLYETFHF